MTTKEQIRLLRPYLVGERPREDGEWDMHCPLHDDKKRSAQINFDKGLWFCHAGCGGDKIDQLIAQVEHWVPPRGAANGGMPTQAVESVSEAKVKGWCSAMMSNEV